VILRYAPSPVGTAITVVTLILVALAVTGFLGAKRGHAAPFVAVALILPYLLAGVTAYAGTHRLAAEVGDLFGADTSSSDSTSDNAGDNAGADAGAAAGAGADEGATDNATDGSDGRDGEDAPKIDGGAYTWANGIKLTMKVTHEQPYGSTDDFCSDGSCGIANPNDLTWVIHYQVTVPKSAKQALDPTSCPGDLHVVDGNDDKSFGSVAGDFSSDPGGKIFPGATKSGDAEYYIERKALGKAFYLESYCGDPDSMEEPAYFQQTIDDPALQEAGADTGGGPCVDTPQFDRVKVGMTQAQVTKVFNLGGVSAGGGAGGFTLKYPNCSDPTRPFYVTFNTMKQPFLVAEKRHP
jgi:hypothetical protein